MQRVSIEGVRIKYVFVVDYIIMAESGSSDGFSTDRKSMSRRIRTCNDQSRDVI